MIVVSEVQSERIALKNKIARIIDLIPESLPARVDVVSSLQKVHRSAGQTPLSRLTARYDDVANILNENLPEVTKENKVWMGKIVKTLWHG